MKTRSPDPDHDPRNLGRDPDRDFDAKNTVRKTDGIFQPKERVMNASMMSRRRKPPSGKTGVFLKGFRLKKNLEFFSSTKSDNYKFIWIDGQAGVRKKHKKPMPERL